MEFVINSKVIGKELIFSHPGKSYIYVDLNSGLELGTLGHQLCYGGSALGSTISYDGDNINEFKRICRNWYRSYVRKNYEENR